MIKFLFGASAAAKSAALTELLIRDAESSIPSILIVPEQQAVWAERMTLEKLPPSAQLTLEVLNFSRLYNRVCREYGGLSYSYITTPLKHIMMWKTLREVTPLLSEYSENAISDPSFPSTMLTSISELKCSSITPGMLEDAANECIATDKSLSARLKDITLIYGNYDLNVSKAYSDSSDDLTRLCDILDEHDFFSGKNVYIDSFSSFTAVEHRVIEKIFKTAKNTIVTIQLPTPSFSDISTASIENSLKILKKNADRWHSHEDIIISNDTACPVFDYLRDNIWALGQSLDEEQKPSCQGRIVMEICDTSYDEVQAAASHILELLSDGIRCRDIAVIMRNADKYRGIIEPAFEDAGIPFFLSEKTDICALAPVKFLLSAIRIRQYNWRKNDVIAHIKTGLCDFPLRSADIFEEYINTWNICGNRFTDGDWTMNPDGFSDRLTERGKNILTVSNDIRKKLCEPLERFFIFLDAAESIPDMCRATYDYINQVGLEQKSKETARKELEYGNKKSASELAGVYDVMVKALADIGEALDGVSASVDDFYTILKTVFDNTDIGTIPTSIDEVTVGSASLLRAHNPKYVFVLGLCEGEFPANPDSSGLLSNADRSALAELDIILGEDEDMRSSDEMMYIKNAFCLPTDKLYLSCSVSDLKGSKRTPSLPFRRVEKMFCDLTPHRFFAYDLGYLAGSPKSAASHLRNIQDAADKAAATKAVAEHLPLVTALSDSSVTTDTCRISPELIKEIIGDKIYISPSSLERYIECPFSYYASYMLSLRETQYGRFRQNNIGTFVHYVLENIVRFAVPTDITADIPTKEELKQEISEIVDRYIKMISPDDALKTKRMEHLYSRLRRLSMLILDSITKEFDDSDFRPAFFELKIDGQDGNPTPVELPLQNGSKIVLKGYIDRVDIWRDNDEVYVRIIDYKTGSKQFSLSDIEHGLNTQMLLYLFSICTNPGAKIQTATALDKSASPIPAGVVYLSSHIPPLPFENFSATEEQIMEAAEQKLLRSGIILNEEKVIHAISHSSAKDILMGVTQKDGQYCGKPLLASDELDDLFCKIQTVLTDIGEKIYEGIADCTPLELSGHDPCIYCKVKQLCRKNNF